MNTLLAHSHKIGAVLSTLLLAACNSNNDPAQTLTGNAPHTPTRTVLVYVVGSDLESGGGAATADINEMLKVGSTDKLNIVITTGGANKDGWKTVKRYLLPRGSKTISSIKELTPLADLGNKNMGSATTLQDFLIWGMQNYPTDTYSLVLWDHGGGAVGGNGTVGIDENHGGDGLSLAEIRNALQTATSTSKKRFDLVGFDTCLMATIETAAIIAPYADYLVASEEVEPGTGWDYKAWLGAIKSKPAITTLELSKKIVDSYYASFAHRPAEQKAVTLSALQLSRLAPLTAELDKLAAKAGNRLNSAPESVRIEVAQGRSTSESYGKQNTDDSGMIDLADFVGKLPAAYSVEADKVKAALNDFVAYNKHGSTRSKASGLSIYLPSSESIRGVIQPSLTTYKQTGFLASWTGFVESYVNKVIADHTEPTFGTTSLVSDQLTVNMSSNDVEHVHILITKPSGASQIVLSKENADEFANNQATYRFDGNVLTMNGQPVYVEVSEETDTSALVNVPAQLNGQQVSIAIALEVVGDTLFFDIIGALPQSFNGTVARYVPIESGDIVEPLFQQINPDGTSQFISSGNVFAVASTGMDIGISKLGTGSYNLIALATDYAGNDNATLAGTVTLP